jgi:hypothetical protein
MAVGKKKYLVEDLSIECGGHDYSVFAPFVIAFLVGFTFGLPLVLTFVLVKNRKTLRTPRMMEKFGFLYDSYKPGAEYWDIQELMRRLMLTGMMVFLPPSSGLVVSLLVSIAAACLLFGVKPHQADVIQRLERSSYLILTFEYVAKIGLITRHPSNAEDIYVLGYLLILLQVIFIMYAFLCFGSIVHIVWTASNKGANEANNTNADEGRAGDRPPSLVRVVPVQQEEHQQQQKSTLKHEIAVLQWQKKIRQTLMKNNQGLTTSNSLVRVKSRRTRTVEAIQKNHQNHRELALKNIEQQQLERRNSLQLRVRARKKKKEEEEKVSEGVAVHRNDTDVAKVVKGGGGGGGGGSSTVPSTHPDAASVTPDKMEEQMKATVEKIRVILKKLMKTQKTLRKWMTHCDKTSKGLLGRADFTKVVRRVVKKVGQKEVKEENLMERIWASVKEGSAEGVGWEVVEHEVVKQWVFPEVE